MRSWLYRIATNTCLRAMSDGQSACFRSTTRPQRPHDGPADPVDDPIWLEPYPDANLGPRESAGPDARYELHEAVELAFVAALQRLPARQRAVLILRDVLGFSARRPPKYSKRPGSVDRALHRRTGPWTNGCRAKPSSKHSGSSATTS